MATQITKAPQYRIADFDDIVRGAAPEYETAVSQHQYRMLWTYAVNCILGLWLISSPFLFNYKSSALVVSDVVSGVLIIAVELLSFSPRRYGFRWLTPFIGVWLLFAPLIFWSPTAAVYLNDTLIACFVIALSIMIPGTPGQGGIEKPGPDQPPGWSYNPSSWIRRWLGIALALLGFFISRYLAACQLGYIQHAWDPLFGGDSSQRVLHSVVSRSFPISDAGFGSTAYILEVLAGFMGDRARWRSSPWIVTTFALLVVPLGVTSIVLVILQPMVVGAWCGLCLIAAAGLLTSVPLAVHEIIAMGQFLTEAKVQHKSVWQVFWKGGSITGGGAKDPDRTKFSLLQRWIASVQGVTIPWELVAQFVVGVWLMARPNLLTANAAAANCDHLIGALAVTVAAVATAEVTRTARYLNMIFGALLIVAAIIFSGQFLIVMGSEIISGLILIISAIPRGEIIERYAGWNLFIK
jgi:Vitamin K epoxide reductase family